MNFLKLQLVKGFPVHFVHPFDFQVTLRNVFSRMLKPKLSILYSHLCLVDEELNTARYIIMEDADPITIQQEQFLFSRGGTAAVNLGMARFGGV